MNRDGISHQARRYGESRKKQRAKWMGTDELTMDQANGRVGSSLLVHD